MATPDPVKVEAAANLADDVSALANALAAAVATAQGKPNPNRGQG